VDGVSTGVTAVHTLVAIVLATFGLVAPPRPAAPTVTGPRDTTLERPVYAFRASRATGFRCSFDSAVLHRCPKRYSERLQPGRHVLRVRAVGRRATVSRLVTVRVLVRLPVPELIADWTVPVGAGAGVPATFASAAYVPVTSDGTLAVVRDGAVASRATVGVPATLTGLLDSAVDDGRASTQRAIWVTWDEGDRVTRIDPGGGTARFDVAPRPGGLTASDRAVWAFHFLQGTITRIDIATMTARRLEVAGAQATGIAAYGGSLWLLTTRPSRVLELDPDTAAVKRTIDLLPPFALRRSLIETWWLAAADGALWATLPNHGAVARIDTTTGAVRYIRTPYGEPFGVAAGAGAAWVATDRAVLQLDQTTGALKAAVLVPAADRTGFVSIAYGYGAAWLTNYDRGTLSRLRAPGTPP
jgi:streptogramin lyase